MRYRHSLTVAAAFVLLGLAADASWAITAWARRYDLPCSACHWGSGYRLTREGQKFMRTGHFNPGDKPSKSFEDYLGLNTKIRFNDGNDAKLTDNKIGDVTFEYHAFALYSGGLIAPNFSFFTELYLHEREGTPKKVDVFSDGGRTKLAEAFLQYTRGGANYFTIRAGQIASQLWYIQGAGGRVAETRSYLVNNATITTNGGIGNKWLPRQRDYGVELGGQYGDLHAVFGVINGTGNSPTNVVENAGQGAKDFYTSADYTLKDMAQFGIFYHNGNLQDPLATDTTSEDNNEDNFYRVGLTFNANPTDRLWVVADYVNGKDEDSKPKIGTLPEVKSNGFSLEGDFLALEDPGIVPFVRYDRFTHDGKSTPSADFDTTTDAFVLGCSFNLFDQQRGRLVFEWQYLKTTEEYKTVTGESASKDLVKDQNLRIELSFML
ncbi:MAG: hypothetical protein AB1714_26635 [Acidobacteriota bacterium]